MTRLILLTALAVLFACGGETGSPGPAETPSVDTGAMAGAETGSISADVASCLELVNASRFADAIPVCSRALQAEPRNADVQTALSTAKREATASGAEALGGQAKRAAEARQAAEGAEAEAGKAAEPLGATKEGITGGLPK